MLEMFNSCPIDPQPADAPSVEKRPIMPTPEMERRVAAKLAKAVA